MSLEITQSLKSDVWWKGQKIDGHEPRVWSRDSYGRVMKFGEYGNRDSEYGWEIDHIIPESKGGSDDLSNLQPLNWVSNVEKSDELARRRY